MKVPDVLLIRAPRQYSTLAYEQSLRKTWERRPDLLENYDFTDEERQILEEIKAEGNKMSEEKIYDITLSVVGH